MEEEISLVELFSILRKHIRIIILTTVFSTLIAFIYTFFVATPKYQSSTEILVSHSTDSTTTSVTQQDINTSIQLINTYSDIIRNDVILDPVIEDLNLSSSTSQLRDNITVQTQNNSQVFSIQVENENPYLASEIANTTAGFFQEKIFEIMNVDNVTIISRATPNVNQVAPNNMLNMVIGILLGGMLGIGIVFIYELTDNTVKSVEYIEKTTGWNNLGEVNIFSKNDLIVKTPLPKTQKVQKELVTDKTMKRSRRRV